MVLNRLRTALSRVFPEECFLSGTGIKERQRAFSIRPAQGEKVLGLKLSPLTPVWPRGKGQCDALFLCFVPARTEFVMCLVELKGGDVERALDQIRDSCRYLCKGAQAVLQIHVQVVIDALTSLNRNGHGRGILGIIVGRKGLPLSQKEKAALWRRDHIRIWPREGQLTNNTCRDLAKEFGA